MPAPVVADALSYHPVTTAKIATHAEVTWSRYLSAEGVRHLIGDLVRNLVSCDALSLILLPAAA
jgi:hypothetical protein